MFPALTNLRISGYHPESCLIRTALPDCALWRHQALWGFPAEIGSDEHYSKLACALRAASVRQQAHFRAEQAHSSLHQGS